MFIVCEFSEEYSIRIFEIAHFAKLRIRSSRPKVVFSSTYDFLEIMRLIIRYKASGTGDFGGKLAESRLTKNK